MGNPGPTDAPAGLQPRQIRNSERVLDAALHVAASEGWAGLTLTGTAVRAQLSRRAVHARFPNRSALGVAVWKERAGPVLADALEQLLRAAGALGGEPSPEALTEILTVLDAGAPTLHAAVELVVVSAFDEAVREAVRATLGSRVAAWCAGPDVDPVAAARRGYLVAVGLGLLMAGRCPPIGRVDWAAIGGPLAAAAQASVTPVELPEDVGADEEYALEAVFRTGDQMLDSLLLATVQLVGQQGYDQTGTAQIAATSGYSEGLLYSRYASKMELFLDATQRMADIRIRANVERETAIAAQHGLGIAEAVTIRSWQHPSLAVQRTLNLEQHRLAWHDAALREAHRQGYLPMVDPLVERFGADGFALFQLGCAVGVGVVALPLLYPDAWMLAYDVMTVPAAAAGLI